MALQQRGDRPFESETRIQVDCAGLISICKEDLHVPIMVMVIEPWVRQPPGVETSETLLPNRMLRGLFSLGMSRSQRATLFSILLVNLLPVGFARPSTQQTKIRALLPVPLVH